MIKTKIIKRTEISIDGGTQQGGLWLKFPIEHLFNEYTIIPNEEDSRDLRNRCMIDGALAIIEKHPKHGLVWHTLFKDNLVFKKRIAKEFEKNRESSIYFIQAISGGLVKIGVADNCEARLSNHQCGSPVKLRIVKTIQNIDRSLEKKIHHKFKEFRKHGEWFDPIVLKMEVPA